MAELAESTRKLLTFSRSCESSQSELNLGMSLVSQGICTLPGEQGVSEARR